MRKTILNNEKETINFGEKISKQIKKGSICLLEGGLGAGKTTLTKGIVKGLGGDNNEVVSPTYVYVKEYTTLNDSVYHLDLYRIKKGDFDIELWDMISENNKSFLIEWSENIGKDLYEYLLKNYNYFKIKIKKINNAHQREITITENE